MSDSRKIREERLARSRGKTKSSAETRADRLRRLRGDTGGGSPGVFGVIGNLGTDLKDAAVNLPAGIGEAAFAIGGDIGDVAAGDLGFRRTRELGSQIVDQYAHTYGPLGEGDFGEFAHRVGQHPLGPILDVATVATAGGAAAGKLEAAARASTAGGAAKALVTKQHPGTRALRVGDLEVEGIYSRGVVARTGQRATDKALQKALDTNPAGRVGQIAQARASRWEERTRRTEEAVARSKANRLEVVGRKLKPHEQMALRLVAEEAPVGRRIAASELRAARMDEAGQARHAERIALMRQAQELLDEGPDGRPVLKAEQAKLQRVYRLLTETSADRETLLESIGRMTPEGAASHRSDVGKVALGAVRVDERAVERTAREIERGGEQAAKSAERLSKQQRKEAVRAATRSKTEAEQAEREWFRLATTRGSEERRALADEDAIIRQVDQLARPEPVLPIETRTVPRTADDARRRIAGLEAWLEPRLARVREVGVDDAKRNLGDKAFSGPGPKPDAHNVFPEAQGAKDPLSIIAKTAPTLNPRVQARQEGLIPQRGLAQKVTKGAVENKAVNEFYEAAKRSSHPSLRMVAERMDELDDLRDLVDRWERSKSFMADEEAPHPGFGTKTERVASEQPSPRGPELVEEDLGAVAGARRQVEDAEAAREARVAEARARADALRAQAEEQYGIAERSSPRAAAEQARAAAANRAAQERARAGTFEGPGSEFEASPDAVYIGDPLRRSKLTGRPQVGGRVIGNPRVPESLTKGYTGRAKEGALERLDTTKIVAERNREAVRLTSMLRLRDRMAKAGTEAPRRVDDVFVRLDNSFERMLAQEETGTPGPLRATGTPDLVRRFLEDPESLAEPELAGSLADRVRNHVFDRDWQLDPAKRAEFEQLAARGQGVFVSKRLLGNLAKRDPRLQEWIGDKPTAFIDAVNNATKAAVIYLKPAYAPPQMLSNLFLDLVHQGFAAPLNLKKSVMVDRALRDRGHIAVIDDLMGEGAVRMLGGEGQGLLGRSTRWIAGQASRVVDTPFRRAAWFHEASKSGASTPQQIISLLDDPARRRQLAEVTARANQAMVDFGEMGPLERSIVRRVVFVYPWVKGSSLLAGRTLRDQPVAAGIGTRVSAVGQQEAEEDLGPTPSYLQGSFGVAGRLVNPASLSPYGTAAQVGQAIGTTLTGNVPNVAEWQQFSSPVLSLATALATRKDSIGRPLDGQSLPEVAYNELVGAAPQTALVKALAGNPRRTGTFPDEEGTDAIYRFFLGGLYPRKFNRATLNENARREQQGR